MQRSNSNLIESLAGKLIVSCQDYTEIMIDAAIRGGATGLRINSPRNVRIARSKTDLPIIGCNKMYFPNSPIYITPSIRAALTLIDAGADIVAIDCTNRHRVRQSPPEIIQAIHKAGVLAVADISCVEEAGCSVKAGVDIIATTLAQEFNPGFIREVVKFGRPVLAEGHVTTSELAKQALEAGAWAVCIGTAITRPHLLTKMFANALENEYEMPTHFHHS